MSSAWQHAVEIGWIHGFRPYGEESLFYFISGGSYERGIIPVCYLYERLLSHSFSRFLVYLKRSLRVMQPALPMSRLF